MDLGRLGVWYAADKLTPPEWADLVSTSETLGYGTIWYSESRGYESMSLAAYLLSCGDRINVGSSIANSSIENLPRGSCPKPTSEIP